MKVEPAADHIPATVHYEAHAHCESSVIENQNISPGQRRIDKTDTAIPITAGSGRSVKSRIAAA
jgi:hypothetical protein